MSQPAEIPPGEDASAPGEGPALTEEARAGFQRLGFTGAQLRALVEGRPTAFILAGAAEGTTCIAHLLPNGRLRIGIYTMRNVGGGLLDFLTFETAAQVAAREIGATEVELLGVEITNDRLRASLERGGFTPTTIPVPEELGGGTADAISRVYPVG